jgi:hypothetical protein
MKRTDAALKPAAAPLLIAWNKIRSPANHTNEMCSLTEIPLQVNNLIY